MLRSAQGEVLGVGMPTVREPAALHGEGRYQRVGWWEDARSRKGQPRAVKSREGEREVRLPEAEKKLCKGARDVPLLLIFFKLK